MEGEMLETSSKIIPCIWFDDQAEQAAAFYLRTFCDGRLVATSERVNAFETVTDRV
jgi:predicted 3-demethylubiquinone-9 3-methyltransferase (glyoxalase superfamily)